MTDLLNNRIPDQVHTIHLMAACGTGMAALAVMLKELGYGVTGSDHQVYPPMSTFLAGHGITIANGFSADNLNHDPDLVVVGNAIPAINPEAREMMRKGLYFCSMPQAVNRFVAGDKKIILITGTHGKTTTSALAAWLLQSAGLDPTFVIGGILNNFNSNFKIGRGPHIVIEGDEYDTAFFDKGPKFLHYKPHAAVLTGVEFDHADIYRDEAHVISSFESMLSRFPETAALAAFSDDSNVRNLIQNRSFPVITYGNGHKADWQAGDVRIAPPHTCFNVLKNNVIQGEFQTTLPGAHNLANILAVTAVADHLGISVDAISDALKTFKGIKRRQEIRGRKRGITIIDDFAHHPTAVRETLKAVKPFYPDGRLIAVFEPRTNSSMRKVFQDVYPQCFDAADMVCIRRPSKIEKIPESERFSSSQLVADLQGRGIDAFHFDDTESILEFLLKQAKTGDAVMIMSNGGFDNIHERLLDAL